jgi:hypothetical protein
LNLKAFKNFAVLGLEPHNEDAWSGAERTAYHQGFEEACEICARAIRSHVMTHIPADIALRKGD